MMRHTTVREALAISLLGFSDSEAATVTISAPIKANITPNKAVNTGEKPLGMKP